LLYIRQASKSTAILTAEASRVFCRDGKAAMKLGVLVGVAAIAVLLTSCGAGADAGSGGNTSKASSPFASSSEAQVNVTDSTTDTASRSARSTASRAATPCLTAAKALAVATKNSAETVELDSDHGYACAGGWAYVNYHVAPHGNHSTRAPQLLDGTWVIGDRIVGCGDATHKPLMPPEIYAYGCGN
jgi:hypothetical protein